jgi:tRNA threonylcarbamoyladenosine biosynthesis protein TsaE
MSAIIEALELDLPDEGATQAVAAHFAQALAPGDRIWLIGDLGAGKTTFIRALLRALGVTGPIKSPTFALVEPYTVKLLAESALSGTPGQPARPECELYHFDFYRCEHPLEWLDAGFAEHFEPPAISAVEWPTRQAQLPPPTWRIELAESPSGGYPVGGRRLRLEAHTERGAQWLNAARPALLRAAQTPAGPRAAQTPSS